MSRRDRAQREVRFGQAHLAHPIQERGIARGDQREPAFDMETLDALTAAVSPRTVLLLENDDRKPSLADPPRRGEAREARTHDNDRFRLRGRHEVRD